MNKLSKLVGKKAIEEDLNPKASFLGEVLETYK